MARGFIGFVDRVGRALVSPRRALAGADAGRRDAPGAPDALLLVLLKLVCGEARFFVAAARAIPRFGIGVAWNAFTARLQAAIGMDLVLILAGGLAVTLLAGRKRSPARDFELGCVAWMPVLAVDVVASLATSLAGWQVSPTVASVIWVVALTWMAALVGLSVVIARQRAR